ncbi:MAG: prepilin peptidase [Saccharofermentanales bacterium]
MSAFLKIITSFLFIILEILVSYCVFRFYNLFPRGWFRDYDSEKGPDGHYIDNDEQQVHPSPRMKDFPDAVWFCSILVFIIFLFFVQYGITYIFICSLLTVLIFSYIFVADLKTRIIPDQFIFSLFFVSFFWIANDLAIVNDTGGKWYWLILMRIAGGLAGGTIFWLISRIGTKLLKQEAMGMGDVKLAAACGVIVSYSGIYWLLILSFLLAFIPAMLNLIKGIHHRGIHFESIPFGPFIVTAATVYLLFPDMFALIYYWYSHLVF